MRSAFSGTEARAGPPLDLCLDLLDCIKDKKGMFRPRLIPAEHMDCTFYDYQITGAVGLILKLYGKIDADKLLNGTNNKDNPRAAKIRQAASKLEDLRINGAILCDKEGFGKTKQALLAAYLHVHLMIIREKGSGKQLFEPILTHANQSMG